MVGRLETIDEFDLESSRALGAEMKSPDAHAKLLWETRERVEGSRVRGHESVRHWMMRCFIVSKAGCVGVVWKPLVDVQSRGCDAGGFKSAVVMLAT